MAATTSKSLTLPEAIFNVEVKNHELLKLAYDSYLADKRLASATTKLRGEVRGGGKKPWRQKGTGRARFGSSRNPIWRGGGIVFGPRGNENYSKKISTSSKRVALRQALTLANKAKKIIPVATFTCPEGKTKEALDLLTKNNLQERDRTLIVLSGKDELVRRAANNLSRVKVAHAHYLSVFDILNADKIIISKNALGLVESWLTKAEKKS